MNRHRTSSVVAAAVVAAAFPIGAKLHALQVPVVPLGDRVAAYQESFGLIGGVRELSGGQVLVADPLGGILVRLDAALQTAETLGGEGEGPGEYRQPDAVWPIGADSSLLVDLGNARLTVIGPDGRLGETMPIVLPGEGGGMGGMTMAIPGGTDAGGNVYFTGSAMGPGGVRDSIDLQRLERTTSDVSAIAKIKPPAVSMQSSGGANNQNVRVQAIPLATADTWGIAPDGGVFLVRERDYSVHYVTPSGEIRGGAAVDYRPVRIGADERQEWADDQARNGGIGIGVQVVNGRRSVSMSRGSRGAGDLDELDWPETKPPFENARVRVDANGHGWVRRHMPAGDAALYDVFDTDGRLVRSVRLPPDRTVVGFGSFSVYVAYTDALDQQFLERYPLP